MLPRYLRLTGKTINYIRKKKQTRYGQVFVFCWILQYPDKKFHQISINIPTFISKSAVIRHRLKRKLLVLPPFIPRSHMYEAINGRFYRIFIYPNKKNIHFSSTNTLNNTTLEHWCNFLCESFVKEWKKFKNFLSGTQKK